MPLLRVDAEDGRPVGPDGSDPDLAPVFRSLPAKAPVMVMIHGYKYAPDVPSRCPHRSILALAPSAERPRRCLSWPRAMGFTGTAASEGLCIAFGWRATGTIWQAARAADRAAGALGALIGQAADAGNRPVHVLAHSLGARVALGALPALRRGTVGRMVLLHAAEFRSRARVALATPAGRTAEIVNVTTRENDLFDALFRGFVGPHRPLDPALSAGLGLHRPNWLDIRIDDPASREALAEMGFAIPPPEGRVCHWSAYMRKGMFDLHRALLRAPARTPLPLLAARLPDGARRGALETAFARLRPAPLSGPSGVPS